MKYIRLIAERRYKYRLLFQTSSTNIFTVTRWYTLHSDNRTECFHCTHLDFIHLKTRVVLLWVSALWLCFRYSFLGTANIHVVMSWIRLLFLLTIHNAHLSKVLGLLFGQICLVISTQIYLQHFFDWRCKSGENMYIVIKTCIFLCALYVWATVISLIVLRCVWILSSLLICVFIWDKHSFYFILGAFLIYVFFPFKQSRYGTGICFFLDFWIWPLQLSLG